MRTRFGLLVVVGLLVAADAKDQAKKLEGSWTGKLVEIKGKRADFGGWTLVIHGDHYTLSGPKVNEKETREEGTFRLDPTPKPTTVDLMPTRAGGKTRLGIYEIDGGRAKACFAALGSKDRPKTLATKVAADEYLWEFERGKGKSAP